MLRLLFQTSYNAIFSSSLDGNGKGKNPCFYLFPQASMKFREKKLSCKKVDVMILCASVQKNYDSSFYNTLAIAP